MEVKPREGIAILSGRYEILHGGHIKTIRRFAREYVLLYVYVVSNPDSIVPNQWTVELIQFCTMDLGNVQVVLNACHFGRATSADIADLPLHDVFLSCNPQVTKCLRNLGENVREFEPTAGYSSSSYKERLVMEATKDWRKSP